jgi:hypothetical protein
MLADPVRIRVRLLRDGQAAGSNVTCDLSPGYVEINSQLQELNEVRCSSGAATTREDPDRQFWDSTLVPFDRVCWREE